MTTAKNYRIIGAALGVLLWASGLQAAAPSSPQNTIGGRAWLDIGGVNVTDLTENDRFPDGYDQEVFLPYFEWNPEPSGDIFTPANNAWGDNYGAQIMGYFHAPASGDYTFWLCADDGADLYLSTDEDPANKVLIAKEAVWSNARIWDTSNGDAATADQKNSSTFTGTEWASKNADGGAKITLQAGKAYYIEALVKEGGGGDNLAVAVEDPNGAIDPLLPIPGEYLSSIYPSGPAAITAQPVGGTVSPLDAVTFSVGVSGTPPYAFQWSKDGSAIDGATGSSYTIDRVDGSHAGSYTVTVNGAQGSATSNAAVLTVSSDSEAPTIALATGSDAFNAVKVVFSEPVDAATGGNASNFKLSGGLTISGASVGAAPNDNTVILQTSKQSVGTEYTVTVNNVQDLFGNAIAAGSSQAFSSFIWQEGVVLHKFWQDVAGGLDGLQNDPRFPDNPSFVTLEPYWEYGPGGSNENGSNYGNQLVGYFVPPEDGNYIFFTNSDDPSNLYLSTDEDPANKLWIAQESGWSNARSWVSVGDGSNVDDKRSDYFINSEWPTFDIKLNAGERYYLESIHTEGGGGDSVAATVIRSSDPDPQDGDAPTLTGALIGTYLDPNGAAITIDQQPASQDVSEGLVHTLSITASGTSAYGDFVGYQWQQASAGSSNFSDIAGATEGTLETPVLTQADNGIQYRVVLTVPTLAVISEVATLNVIKDTVPAEVLSVAAKSANKLLVKFNEGIDATSGAVAGNYAIFDGVLVSAAVVSGSSVVIDTSDLTPDASYTLTVQNVKDLYGNAIGSSSLTFKVRIVTYGEVIQSDGPIAYYRFEETSGMVAKNYGTLGEQADGLWMSGAGVDDSIEVDANSDAGPRPADGLLGFGNENRAASFTGDYDQFWVETQGQWLNGLSAFTLEYWVKPINREGGSWSRVGIVGQNDAVEYGFINGTTIQIWTPGGGSLNTTYEFADDEWHHIATIADGTQIHNYFDGELINSSGNATGNYGSSGYNVHIGGGGVYDATGNSFEGFLDEVAIFDKAIPAERVREHYIAGLEGGTLAPPEPFVLAINFASDEPAGAGSAVDGAAGVLGTTVWNNLVGAAGEAADLDIQLNGAAAASAISVSWSSPNTWSSAGRGEENNTGTGNDGNLMTGYIDTNATDPNSVTVSGLSTELPYDVIVYMKGGVVGRGGDYAIGDQVLSHIDTGAFDGNYVHGGEGDYIIFKDLSGESFTLTGTPINVRAPINAIEVVMGGGVEVPGGGGGSGSISSVALSDGSVVIEYTGTLKSASSVTGPYSAVAGASSPYSVAPTQAAEFYIAE
jgi:hypothetical protein